VSEKNEGKLLKLIDVLGLDEEPMGVYYTDTEPTDGVSPKPQKPVSREAEEKGEIDWNAVLENFSCVIGNVWRARKKKTAAFFDRERFGCIGGAFYLGFLKPYLNIHPYFISTGLPNVVEGERYADSPEAAQAFFDAIDPLPAPARYCVIKPISQFSGEENPPVVVFFVRPEALSGLFSLVAFLKREIEAVRTPFGPGCSGLVTWPMKYLDEKKECAVIGSFDPSCRKFLRTDELTFAVPYSLYQEMLDRWEESFLITESWKVVKKKIEKSKKKKD
jgi:uncharacterized protein (DUF169 family)